MLGSQFPQIRVGRSGQTDRPAVISPLNNRVRRTQEQNLLPAYSITRIHQRRLKPIADRVARLGKICLVADGGAGARRHYRREAPNPHP